MARTRVINTAENIATTPKSFAYCPSGIPRNELVKARKIA